jgi:23S rRNA (adenine1618-N6)-methyltransferase
LSLGSKTSPRDGLHPRNRHHGRYDFAALVKRNPCLAAFVQANPAGEPTIDFADPIAVLALNRALLQQYYGIGEWTVPPGYLCPPIPGRADYVHHLADLLASESGNIPRGPETVVLDIGVGANCIYPIIGAVEYGWRFVGTDIDRRALTAAKRIVAANPVLSRHVECRLQSRPERIFASVVAPNERFAASMCNPPFHASAQEAAVGTLRKVRNLSGRETRAPERNFGGQSQELWCEGGEVGFVRRMIVQSAAQPQLCRWFTTLISKRDSLRPLEKALQAARVADVRTIPMAHGQKKSRILAWRY